MKSDQKAKLIAAINRHEWFHVRPDAAPGCYQERGRFYAATYVQAMGYGKPYLNPDRVTLTNTLIGEHEVMDTVLFGSPLPAPKTYRGLCQQEAKRKRRAEALGYDSTLLLPKGSTDRFMKSRRVPAGAELCLINLRLSEGPATDHSKPSIVSDSFCTSAQAFLPIAQARNSYTGREL